MQALSAVIIAYNEAAQIHRCIESVLGLADEVLVVDSGSTDETVSICLALGVRVVHQPFLGYIEQKNFATSQAKNDWVLSLDADEVLSAELLESIRKVLQNPVGDGYTMNRLTNYCGYWVKHGGWYPDKKLRLYFRTKGRWAGINPHDRYDVQPGAVTGHLEGDLLHYSYNTLSDHIRQIDRFSSIGAAALHKKGIRSSWLKLLYKPPARFIRHYFVWSGFRDGLTGFVIAVNSAHAVFLKYLRLYFLQKGRTI